MKPMLFVASEFLKKMTDQSIPVVDREGFRFVFSSYIHTEDGIELAPMLIDSFNVMSPREIGTVSPDVLIWYLDWATSQVDVLVERMSTTFLEMAWLSIDHDVVRTRLIESIVLVEALTELPPSNSAIGRVISHLMTPDIDSREMSERSQKKINEVNLRLMRSVLNTLLTEQSEYGLRVLGACMRLIPEKMGNQFLEEISTTVEDMGKSMASKILRQIGIDMKRE